MEKEQGRKLASIQTIKATSPIVGADAIEKLEILGWELVGKKNEFKVGDYCVYIEIDSILPDRPEFEFMRARKFRVKTIKLRGQISQGIAFPMDILYKANPNLDITPLLKEGNDVTGILGIEKYDPEQESIVIEKDPVFDDKNHLVRFYKKYKWLITKKVKKLLGISTKTKTESWPSYIPKTDETRVQTMLRGLEDHEGSIAYISEKLEGSSTTFVSIRVKGNFFKRLFKKQPKEFIVCSRNMRINNHIDDRWQIAKKYELANKMNALTYNFAIQGELIGPKVQGNIYELKEKDFRMFLAYNIDEKRYFTFSEMTQLATMLGIQTVPILETSHVIHTDIKKYVEMSKAKSMLNPKKDREGIVIRTVDDRFSFKSINPDYLLGQKD